MNALKIQNSFPNVAHASLFVFGLQVVLEQHERDPLAAGANVTLWLDAILLSELAWEVRGREDATDTGLIVLGSDLLFEELLAFE